MGRIRAQAPTSFSGLGLVFYEERMTVPCLPLGDSDLFEPTLPILGVELIARTLAQISQVGSPWHDGFHLIATKPFALTHVSQFLAPTLTLHDGALSGELPMGARQMAAKSASRAASVVATALLSNSEGLQIYRNGHRFY